MTNVFPKFIVEEYEEGLVIILGKCSFHKQLATDISKVRGGGMWRMDREAGNIYLNGSSYEFGKCSIDDLATCVQNKRVFSSPSMMRNLTEEFRFEFEDFTEKINLQTYNPCSK